MSNPGTGRDVEIYDGTALFMEGITPFGFYDDDVTFQKDAPRVARFVCMRLGYPIMDVELQSGSIFAAFEEAVTTYGNQIYAWKVKENYLSLEGGSTQINANNMVLEPSLQRLIEIAKNYGTEAEVGGNITLHKGLLDLKPGVQEYDLDQWALEQGIEGGIEIRKIFYEAPPAILRYFDPYAGTGTGIQSLMDAFDFGSYSPGVNFLLMPVSADILKIQAIEFNDQVRRSAYSFRISNNKLTIFPIPHIDGKLRIEYYKLSDKKKLNTTLDYVSTMASLRMPLTDIVVPSGSSSVTKEFIHNLNTENVSVKSYFKTTVDGQEGYYEFIPGDIQIWDKNTIHLTFTEDVDDGFIDITYPVLKTTDTGQAIIGQNIAFSAQAGETVQFMHNLKTTNITSTVYIYSGSKTVAMIPEEVRIVSSNEIDIKFTDPAEGYVVLSSSDVLDASEASSVITNVSEVPYENPTYSKINSIGRQWIFRYTLALCKEILAYIRGKYEMLPIPDSETRLNQADLLADARKEKDDLIKELGDMLETTSRQSQLERRAQEAEYLNKTLTGVPMLIFVG